MWTNKNDLQAIRQELRAEMQAIRQELRAEMQAFQQEKIKLAPEQETRLKELELWQTKLHALMIEKTPGNKEKLNRNFHHLRGRI